MLLIVVFIENKKGGILNCLKHIFLTVIVLVAYCSKGYAQDVLINQNGGIPDGSAALEVQSNSKGFLPPRLTTVQANAISSPADGLLIFNLDSACYCYFNGSSWVTLVNSGDTLSTISDNDGDTRIETEPGVDGDSIALYTQGNQVMHLSDIGTVGFGRSAPTNAEIEGINCITQLGESTRSSSSDDKFFSSRNTGLNG